MRRGSKLALAGAGALVVSVPVLRVVASVRADRTLHAYVEAHADEVATERARLVATRLPARHGPPTNTRCADAQSSLLRDVGARGAPIDYAKIVAAWPATRLTTASREWVRTRAARLDDLRATLGCLRTLDERASGESMSAGLRLTAAARDVILDGMAHAEDGDALGAIERELDAIRLGEQASVTTSGTLIADAAVALARILASTSSGGALDGVTQGLDALEPFVPAPTAIADEMKLLAVDAARDTDPDPVGKLDAPRYYNIQGWQRARMRLAVLSLPKRAIVASAVTQIDAQLDRAIDVLRSGDAARAHEVEESLEAENAKTDNPIVWLTAVPATIFIGREIGRGACAIALARATVAIERTRDPSGDYGSPAMPDDPCAHGTPLGFALTSGGAGYRVSSAGEDQKDDIVATRNAISL